MTNPEISDTDFPGLYQSANSASLAAQRQYFGYMTAYLFLLILAAAVSFQWPTNLVGAFVSVCLFLITLSLLVAMRVWRPDDIWYNGRAVAESVKTRTWRWMTRADPYEDNENVGIVSKTFITDLKAILDQNRNLSKFLDTEAGSSDPISKKMKQVRSLDWDERLAIYRDLRIDDQAKWYSKKSLLNKKRAQQWFWVSVGMHAAAICMLIFRVNQPGTELPVEVVATAASAVLTWIQAKKFNELHSSYGLTAHEIVLIKGDATQVTSEKELAEFVVNSEAAFSREHTQWVARKTD